MTVQLSLSSFLFLLTVSSMVSGGSLLGVEDQQNATVANSTVQNNNTTELQTTSGPPNTPEIRDDHPKAAPTHSQNASDTTRSQPSQGNGTNGNLHHVEGSERNSSKHQSAGNESAAGTESPPQTSFPEKSGTSSPTLGSAHTFTASMGPTNGSNATNSAQVVTTSHVSTDGPSKSITTHSHVSTQKPNSSSTKVCPTAELKKENLVGRCLIAIASLAALATIFIMTTIILATKLAGSRYRHRASLLHETEMVCISALMNDSDHPIPAPRHPKSNSALLPITADEDGDDLTLNSFLHDTEGVA